MSHSKSGLHTEPCLWALVHSPGSYIFQTWLTSCSPPSWSLPREALSHSLPCTTSLSNLGLYQYCPRHQAEVCVENIKWIHSRSLPVRGFLKGKQHLRAGGNLRCVLGQTSLCLTSCVTSGQQLHFSEPCHQHSLEGSPPLLRTCRPPPSLALVTSAASPCAGLWASHNGP